MIVPDLSGAVWHKSSRSGTNANCVEVAAVPAVRWVKSSRSGSNSDCVEVAVLPCAAAGHAEPVRVTAVRDSKDPTGPVLAFTRQRWADFLAGLSA